MVSNTADALLLNNVGQAGNGDVFITNSGDLSVKRVIAAMGAVDLVATGSILRRQSPKQLQPQSMASEPALAQHTGETSS